MRRFLEFVVNKTIDGEAESLKEYLIGVEVYGRADFDPRTDTIVRVEARRLRKKLEEYYAAEGQQDQVRVCLPSGSYVPVFATQPGPLDPVPGEAPRSTPIPNRRVPSRRVLVTSALIAMVATLLMAISVVRKRPVPVTVPIASIAVLPFLDMSPTRDQEFLSDGLSEELINALSAVPNLKVAARTSSFRYKGRADDVRRIGAELGVEHILEGSLRFSGKRVRITAQLIRVRDGYLFKGGGHGRHGSTSGGMPPKAAPRIGVSAVCGKGSKLPVLSTRRGRSN